MKLTKEIFYEIHYTRHVLDIQYGYVSFSLDRHGFLAVDHRPCKLFKFDNQFVLTNNQTTSRGSLIQHDDLTYIDFHHDNDYPSVISLINYDIKLFRKNNNWHRTNGLAVMHSDLRNHFLYAKLIDSQKYKSIVL